MDKFERLELLEEFLVRWGGGRTIGIIESELVSRGWSRADVEACSKIFAKWVGMKKPWTAIKRIRA